MRRYRDDYGSNPTTAAQSQLSGRTHYADADTLRYFRARILRTVIAADGLLLALVESRGADLTISGRRRFAYAIFDVSGRVVSGRGGDQNFGTRRAAETAMWRALDSLDATAITRDAIAAARAALESDAADLEAALTKREG